MNADISIIIPIYRPNYDYLDECFNSIIPQLDDNDQVICVLNGNSDSENELIKAHIPNTFDIIIVEKGGVSNARNIGMSSAKNNHIIFIDCDDIVVNSLFKRAREIIDNKNPDFITFLDTTKLTNLGKGNLTMTQLKKEEHLKIWQGKECELSSHYQFRSCWNHIYKREIIFKNNIHFNTNQKIAEDTLFNFEYALNSKEAIICNYISYFYRQNRGGSTIKYNENAIDDIVVLESNYRNLLRNNNIINNEYLHHLYFETLFNYLPYIFRSYIFNKKSSLNILEKRKVIKNICKNDYFKASINSLKKGDTLTKKQYILLILLKARMYLTISLIYKSRQ